MELNIAVWLMGAVIVVGLAEWAKAGAETLGTRPFDAKAFRALLVITLIPIASFAVGLSAEGGNVYTALGIWAVAQIGYELIIRTVKKKLGGE